MTVQQALNLRVTARAQRAGSYKGPYSIINTSLTATIWVANNPSVQPNQGTSVSPGTSLTWTPTDNDDLYIILGTDTSSTPLGYADVIISFDTALWQPSPAAIAAAVLNSGTILVDNPTTVIDQQFLASGYVSPLYDVATYQSIVLRCSCTAIGAPATSAYVNVQWYNDAAATNLVGYDLIQFTTPNGGLEWHGQIPARGRYFNIRITAVSGLGTCTVFTTLTLSRRVVQNLVQTPPGSVVNGPLQGYSNQTIAPGFGTRVYLPPWFGEIEIACSLQGAANAAYLRIENVGMSGQLTFDYIDMPFNGDGAYAQLGAGVSPWFNKIRVACFGNQLSLIPANGTGGNLQFQMSAMPVRYNP